MVVKRQVKLGEGIFYIPKDCVDDGYRGETTVFFSAKTITIAHPMANLDDVEQSLEIVLSDIRLRKKKIMEEKDKTGQNEISTPVADVPECQTNNN